MMARHSTIRATGVVSIFGAGGPVLDEVGLSASIAQAAPGEGQGCCGGQGDRSAEAHNASRLSTVVLAKVSTAVGSYLEAGPAL